MGIFSDDIRDILVTLHSHTGCKDASPYLGRDGGLRLLKDRKVCSAIGLNNDQVQRWLRSLRTKEETILEYQEVDGTSLSHDELFHPAEEMLPRECTDEEMASMIRIIDKQTEFSLTLKDRLNPTPAERLALLEVQNQSIRDEMELMTAEARQDYQESILFNEELMAEIRQRMNDETAEN